MNADRQGPIPTASRLYACRVLHERFSPKRHRFAYRVFYLALDLDELDALGRRLPFFSVNARNLFSLRESDYLPTGEPLYNSAASADRGSSGGGVSLKRRVLAFCAAHGVELGDDARVTLLTLPRMFGYAFNPVSFYLCSDASGERRCAIAEVTNTYREMKAYFLPQAPSRAGSPVYRARMPKHFYVSPFSGLDVEFDFELREPGRTLAVRIDDFEGGRRTLHSTLTGEAHPLTGRALATSLFRYPLLTARVIALIHWQALRLWLKRVPHFSKASQPELQRDLRRPHSSIAKRTPA
ncbi:hypothetical protein GALL_126950 [mine drainage metagenome]|uniref:DUF1365 domain-containing protein n=1 Tax=mine drainage metagenome TaxID=410659 RepID=A0A1J5S9E4_9ZZZZ